ncbi:MAG: Rab family GTPase [Candidatus Hodarchaeota archaeon]
MKLSDTTLTLKIMVCGEGGVGKTTIINRFTGSTISIGETPVTVGIDFATHTINTSNRTIKLQIWDCSGQEQFRFFLSDFYKGALGSLVVFDLTRYETFEKVYDWLKLIEENAKDIPRILIGNKADEKETRAIDQVSINSMISKGKFNAYFETSAKTGQNIVKPFAVLTAIILKRLTRIIRH